LTVTASAVSLEGRRHLKSAVADLSIKKAEIGMPVSVAPQQAS
jgi:hypothetical protein